MNGIDLSKYSVNDGDVTREKYLPAIRRDVVPLEEDEITPKIIG